MLLQYYGLNGYETALQNADFGGFPPILYTTAQTRLRQALPVLYPLPIQEFLAVAFNTV